MRSLSLRAQIYMLVTFVTGATLAALALSALAGSVDAYGFWMFLAVAAAASTAQVRFTQGPTATSSYNLSFVVYGFALAALGPATAVGAVLIACAVDWIWHKYPWFIQMFNVSVLVIAAAAAGELVNRTNDPTYPGFVQTAGLAGAVAVFVLANHVLVAAVIWLTRNERPSESGALGRMTLIIDATLTAIGVSLALIWAVNPSAVLVAAPPIYLLSLALRVPSLERQATTDPKTGLHNARFYQEALERELARANRLDRPLSVVVGDLDLLREVNNLHGHLAGDAAIITAARVLRQAVRDYDVVARFGGEEFTLLFAECTSADAANRIEEIRHSLEITPIDIGGGHDPIHVTMSFGVAERMAEGEDSARLLHRADVALYAAKEAGRNCVRVAGADDAGEDVLSSPERTADPGPDAEEAPSHSPHAPDDLVARADVTAGAHTDRSPASAPPPEAREELEDESPVALGRQPRADSHSIRAELGLITSVVGAAIAAFAATYLHMSKTVTDTRGLLVFAAVCLLAELLSIDIRMRDSSVSTAGAPFIAGVLIFGPMGALTLSLVVSLAAMLKHRSPARRIVFNTGVHLLAATVALWLGAASGSGYADAPLWLQATVAVAATMCYFVITSVLVSMGVSLTGGGSVRRVWQERFRWVAPTYIMLGVAAYAMWFGYSTQGIAGVLVIVAPLLAIRLGLKEHVDHSEKMLRDLHEANWTLRQRNDEVSRLNEDLLEALSLAVDMRDQGTAGHSTGVVRYATAIAQEMGLSAARVEIVRKASLLHDLGKIGIPDHILFKPSALTDEEYEVVKRHPGLGAQLLGCSNTCLMLAPLVRHHHERYDGRGYPDNLRGPQIPLESRIIAVADSVDAMASDRPYRTALSREAIEVELLANAGTQFDHEVVTAFMSVLRRESERLVRNSATAVSRAGESAEGRWWAGKLSPRSATQGSGGGLRSVEA